MSDNKIQKYRDALDDVLDRPIAYNPAFKKITGSTVAGIFLSQAWYWSKRHKEDGGWFWKSGKEWEEETGLSRSEQETARTHCKRVGILDEKLKGVPATLFYRINKLKVYELLGFQFAGIQQTEIEGTPQTGLREPSKQDCDIPANINKVSEIPTETPPMGGLSADDIEKANAKVTAMIENGKKAKYQNRDKLPEPYLVYADVYNELTGQEPTKRVIFDWMSTFEDWKAEGLQPEHIRAAWQHANRPEGGFVVGRPGSLTNTAVAMKSKTMAKVSAAPKIDDGELEKTRRMLEEKEKDRQGAIPRPAYLPRPRI